MNREIIGVMACDHTGVISIQGRIPWYYYEDLKHFHRTIGKVLVMGMKTFNSIPKSVTEGKLSIVFSRQNLIDSSNTIYVRSIEDFFLNKTSFIIIITITKNIILLVVHKWLSYF